MTKKGKHTVLFICLGNICRSPAAEGIMKSLVEKEGYGDLGTQALIKYYKKP